jgi:hypothetical protein
MLDCSLLFLFDHVRPSPSQTCSFNLIIICRDGRKHNSLDEKYVSTCFRNLPSCFCAQLPQVHLLKPSVTGGVKPEAIRPHIQELTGDPKRHYDGLLGEIGDAYVVLIGEGTHGTREFYEELQSASSTRRSDKHYQSQ